MQNGAKLHTCSTTPETIGATQKLAVKSRLQTLTVATMQLLSHNAEQ